MSAATADIVGNSPNPAPIVIAIDTGTIINPPLLNGATALPFGPQQITIPANSLPKNDSFIAVQIVFAPGDLDANITVASGPATVNAPATLDHTMFPSGINLFGE
jgi:hypothetical protein